MKKVAPLAGAWIEIDIFIIPEIFSRSLPSRERGLKFVCVISATCNRDPVAPLAGAWIEIIYLVSLHEPLPVAPLAGAWIEILSA